MESSKKVRLNFPRPAVVARPGVDPLPCCKRGDFSTKGSPPHGFCCRVWSDNDAHSSSLMPVPKTGSQKRGQSRLFQRSGRLRLVGCKSRL